MALLGHALCRAYVHVLHDSQMTNWVSLFERIPNTQQPVLTAGGHGAVAGGVPACGADNAKSVLQPPC